MKLTLGSCVVVEGTLMPSPAPEQPFEIRDSIIDLIGPSDPQVRTFYSTFNQ
jgi:aspartyl/asparaginyl-tRNA synthetase